MATSPDKRIVFSITQALRGIQRIAGFQDWCTSEGVQTADYVVVNNTFIYREAGTSKAAVYLAAPFTTAKSLGPPIIVSPGKAQNADFRHIYQREPLPTHVALIDTVRAERARLGTIVYSLISTVTDDRSTEVTLNAPPLVRLRCDPKATSDLVVKGDSVTLRALGDEETLWKLFEGELRRTVGDVPPGVETEFARALGRLQGEAAASLRLPKRGSVQSGLLDEIVKALRGYHLDYGTALSKWRSARVDQSRAAQFNEVLRIAYAFAAESTALLKLIGSVCDLKPLILWMTIDKHYSLSEAFRALPWSRSKNKPSVGNYLAMIGDSRNHVFHNVLPFQKALHFIIPDTACSRSLAPRHTATSSHSPTAKWLTRC